MRFSGRNKIAALILGKIWEMLLQLGTLILPGPIYQYLHVFRFTVNSRSYRTYNRRLLTEHAWMSTDLEMV